MLNATMLQTVCRAALAEDVGSGDATTLATIPEDLDVEAAIVARDDGVCAGLPVARAVFAELDPSVHFEALAEEGERCSAGRELARLTGAARAVLTGERTSLNFLQRLSGIATLTRRYVDAVGGHKARILDTRKTTPGLRALEKYAVTMGGGRNHRFGLYDRILIKDNHRELVRFAGADTIPYAVRAAREAYPALEVEVEADTLDDVEAAIAAKADHILLDNMSDEEIAAAVVMNQGQALLEVSGGVTLERVPRIAAMGVDSISVGALTHSAKALDIGLDVRPAEAVAE